ncbi:MAG: carbohydrate ABC transporter permease [Clostridiales bacterium]|jgi:multiple sugar transport system permease protein|nr:carbohydrate ABC transporter permease [Clostridiales bacterium]
MTAATRKKISVIVFIAVAAIVVLSCIFPLFWLYTSGFKIPSDFLSYDFRLFPSQWTADNYSGLITDNLSGAYLPKYSSVVQSVYATLTVASVALVLSLFTNSAAAYVFARLNFKGKKIVWLYYAVTMFVPNMAVMIPCYQIVSSLGMLNTFWGLTLPGVPYVWSIFFYRQFYLSVPRSLEDAARVDGCGRIRIYFRIFLPLSGTPFVIMGISVFQGFWNSYIWPIMTVDNPMLMQLNQLISYFKSSQGTQWHYLIAGSALASVPLIVLLVVFQKFIIQGVKISGIK